MKRRPSWKLSKEPLPNTTNTYSGSRWSWQTTSLTVLLRILQNYKFRWHLSKGEHKKCGKKHQICKGMLYMSICFPSIQRQWNPSQDNATLCVIKNNFTRPNRSTHVIFYHAHILFYIILHFVPCEYIYTLPLLMSPCILSLLANSSIK